MPSITDPELRDRFLAGMSQAACTVSIITTDGAAGRAGVTVSAMASVSADTPKPQLLVCVHQLSPAAQKIIDNGVFCVNVLKDSQSYISDTFAGRFKDSVKDKFECADWIKTPTGSLRIDDPLVGFDCKIASSVLVGTHYVFFGEVQDIFVTKQGSPLVYANRSYGMTSQINSAPSIMEGQETERETLTLACVHTFGPYFLPEMVSQMQTATPPVQIKLIEGDQRRALESLLSGESELALLYDIDLPEGVSQTALAPLIPYVLLSDSHPLAKQREISIADLRDQGMVALDVAPSRQYFQEIMENEGVTPNIVFRSASFETVRGLVGHGVGYALLATKPTNSVTYDGRALVTRPLICRSKARNVVLAARKGHSLSKPAEQMVFHCQQDSSL